MSLNEELVEAAVKAFHEEPPHLPGWAPWDKYPADWREPTIAAAAVVISYYLEHLPEPTLPERMRQAAEVVDEADRRLNRISGEWTRGGLISLASSWEAEDRDKEVVRSLAADLSKFDDLGSWEDTARALLGEYTITRREVS